MSTSSADLHRYCKALNLTPPATAAEVKQAYRDMVLIWHPDRFTANPRLQKKAEARMREINEAYEALQRGVDAPAWEPPRAQRPNPPPHAQHERHAGGAGGGGRPRASAPGSLQVLARRLAALYHSIPLPVYIPRPLPPALLSAVLVTGFILGSVWLIKSLPAVQTPLGAIETAPISYRLSTMLSALTWNFRVVTLPETTSPAPDAAATTTSATRGPRQPAIAGEPQHGANLIMPSRATGAGVIRIRNTADLDAAVSLTYARHQGEALRMVYVRAGGETRIRGIEPGEYLVQAQFGRRWRRSSLTFAESRTQALPVGPFSFVQVHRATGIQSDEYEVVLTRR